ncbi:BON domain-containing protein [Photobacterium kishitanii]|uniref:BON domain-containing protein n=1 Tax=Photobacterium kishitanii TaxID=318456 RepID=A0A0B7J9G0_9GAMM|nr:BON domain-containing protein [Photobacterium kishitanii]OBU28605.1 hemolysin [Photobacterium kishitanii]PSU88680.1 BON domain-containing protein [Photobacterium kishitanii]PSU93360.1 BON domain-containing protein [Photobacterium kishitanii]PSU94802.1 BON domain-containing protein [Photobacterium kishitanii]PSV24419.1 BON domain-containing protein [Photobacterium kishitanii]
MKWLLALLIISSLSLSGCSVFSTQDPRNNTQHWQDQKTEMDIAGIAHTRKYTKQLSIDSVALDGTVLLVGQATSQPLKQAFVTQVRAISDVKRIYDQIQVRPLLTMTSISNDAWLTTKVKSQLIASKQLTNVVIKVITENKQVFLLGYVGPEQAAIAANIARNVSGVKHVITLFEKPLTS